MLEWALQFHEDVFLLILFKILNIVSNENTNIIVNCEKNPLKQNASTQLKTNFGELQPSFTYRLTLNSQFNP